MFCSTNIINYTFVIEILRKLYVSWSNNSERDTTRRFKLNGGKEKNKIRKKKGTIIYVRRTIGNQGVGNVKVLFPKMYG